MSFAALSVYVRIGLLSLCLDWALSFLVIFNHKFHQGADRKKERKEIDWGLTLIERREANSGAMDTLLVAKVRVR